MRLGLREANQQFSRAIRAVKAGEEVVLTERGKPVAVIRPLAQQEDIEPMVRRLRAAGQLRPAAKPSPMPSWAGRALKGVPLSHTVREERDAS